MQTLKTILLLFVSLLMSSCNNAAEMPAAVNLVLTEPFRGEIFVLEDQEKGQNWRSGSISVSSQGVVLVKDLAGLSELSPLRFRATYPNGRKLEVTDSPDPDLVTLRPLSRIRGLALYFVIGTFTDQVRHQNESMKWDEFMSRIRSLQADSKQSSK